MEYYPISQSGRFDIDPIPLLELEVGDTVSLDLNGYLTRGAPSVVWSVDGGALPPGVSLSAEGIVSGQVVGLGGAYVVQVKADAGALGLATQGLAALVAQEDSPPVDPTVWAVGTGGNETVDFVENGATKRAYVFNATGAFTCTTAGWVFVREYGGGGGTGVASGGSGGAAGGYCEFRVWVEPGSHPIEVGAGAANGTGSSTSDPNRHGYRGSDSRAFGHTAPGGGGGRGVTTSTVNLARTSGGSGGGGCYLPGTPAASYGGGLGTQYYGKNGAAAPTAGTEHYGAGGGGAGSAGSGINGGQGVEYTLDAPRQVCGGGAGTRHTTGPVTLGAASHGAAAGQNGAQNSGAGGSGVNDGSPGRSGGSGRVEIIVGIA